jgi:hypothetical protein
MRKIELLESFWGNRMGSNNVDLLRKHLGTECIQNVPFLELNIKLGRKEEKGIG